MTHRWIDPRSGSERVSDDSPGEGWLAIVTISMPDGTEVDSTIPGIYTYLSNQDIGGSKSLDTANNRIDLDFPDRPAYDAFRAGGICTTILACPYFLLAIEEEDEDGVLATLSMDPDADSLPPEDDTFQKMQRDTTLVRPGGGGGRPVPPPGPPPIPWDPNLPFPGDPGQSAPMPDMPDQIPDSDQLPDTGDVDLEQAARDQADQDADGVGVDPDKPGDIPHPDAKHPGECDACGGTGQDPGDDGDGGDDQGDDDGAGGDEEDDLLKGFFEDEDDGDGDGDQESDDGGGSGGDQPSDSGAGDGDPGGDGAPGECQECNGTGEQQPDDQGDDGGDDGDDDDDGDDEDEDENLPELIDVANATIDEANAAMAAYSADESPETVRGHIDKCMDLVDTCHKMAQSRSVLQRSILRKAVDAARRALDLEDRLGPVPVEVEGDTDE